MRFYPALFQFKLIVPKYKIKHGLYKKNIKEAAMTMYDILVSVGISTGIAKKAYLCAKVNHLSPMDQNKMICCVVEKYAPDKYSQLAEQHPDVVQDCSPEDDCEAILTPAGI